SDIVTRETSHFHSPAQQAGKENVRPHFTGAERSPLLERRTGLSPEQFAAQSARNVSIPDSHAENTLSLQLGERCRSSSNQIRRLQLSSGARPMAVDSAVAHDMCLPSPSLSPVAAMAAQHLDMSFDSGEDHGTDTDSSLDHHREKL